MNEHKYTIKNSKVIYTVLPFVLIFLVLRIIALAQDDFDFGSITATGHINNILVVLVLIISIVDLVRLKMGKINVVIAEESVIYHQFFLVKTEIKIDDIKQVELDSKNVAILLKNGKIKSITGFEQSDAVLIIKDIRSRL